MASTPAALPLSIFYEFEDKHFAANWFKHLPLKVLINLAYNNKICPSGSVEIAFTQPEGPQSND